MKIAVMGDIHSNHIAFRTCINHAIEKNVDEFIFLGDYISDCSYPQKTMQILYEMDKKYKCRFIRGNREDYMINHKNNPDEKWTYSSTSGSLLYTYENLFKDDLDFFESLDIKGIYEKEGLPSFRYCHGSLNSSKEYVNDENLEAILNELDVNYLIGAHTHIQGIKSYGIKKYINCGSVGIPLNCNGKSQYMILHGTEDGWKEEFFQIDYDVNAVIKEYETSGLDKKAPYWTKLNIHLLKTGEDVTYQCIMLAKKLCKEAGDEISGLDIPEKYMEMAVKNLNIGL